MPPKTTALKILDVFAVLLLGTAAYLALVFAPTEAVMGDVQRVFYFHVATAWVGMLGFMAATIAGLLYLITKNMKWDNISMCSVEISLVFFFITIVLGSIWARPIWNTWWTWDPRLTTAAITELIYVAYFMLRQATEDPERRARNAAVYTLLFGPSVPITFLAIRMYRTIHPVVVGAGQGESLPLTADMKTAFFFALFAFTVIFVDLFLNRIRLGRLQEKVEQLRMNTMA
jgi:heme exporter protein C